MTFVVKFFFVSYEAQSNFGHFLDSFGREKALSRLKIEKT